ncbi:hypothetical protein ABZV31_37695 [Streptomyces sp. NPDC005202]|uniref:hypothetical protein n=1 Tax=Streptomyces sp. NPDC005202 TaxID=3157021 RepID=UPI0033B3F22E
MLHCIRLKSDDVSYLGGGDLGGGDLGGGPATSTVEVPRAQAAGASRNGFDDEMTEDTGDGPVQRLTRPAA